MVDNCIFCRIAAGELPCSKVYEDEQALAFLDINPIEKGHALVIPKAHSATLMETPGEALAAAIKVVKRIAAAQMACGAQGVNVLQSNGECAGQEVFHLHFHVIPRREGGRSRDWRQGVRNYASDSERDQFAEELRAAAERGEKS